MFGNGSLEFDDYLYRKAQAYADALPSLGLMSGGDYDAVGKAMAYGGYSPFEWLQSTGNAAIEGMKSGVAAETAAQNAAQREKELGLQDKAYGLKEKELAATIAQQEWERKYNYDKLANALATQGQRSVGDIIRSFVSAGGKIKNQLPENAKIDLWSTMKKAAGKNPDLSDLTQQYQDTVSARQGTGMDELRLLLKLLGSYRGM